jgi:hypothetical protein
MAIKGQPSSAVPLERSSTTSYCVFKPFTSTYGF